MPEVIIIQPKSKLLELILFPYGLIIHAASK